MGDFIENIFSELDNLEFNAEVSFVESAATTVKDKAAKNSALAFAIGFLVHRYEKVSSAEKDELEKTLDDTFSASTILNFARNHNWLLLNDLAYLVASPLEVEVAMALFESKPARPELLNAALHRIASDPQGQQSV